MPGKHRTDAVAAIGAALDRRQAAAAAARAARHEALEAAQQIERDRAAQMSLSDAERQCVDRELYLLHRRQNRDLVEELRRPPSAGPTAEAEALKRRETLSSAPQRFKNLSRFGYWRIPEINPHAFGDDHLLLPEETRPTVEQMAIETAKAAHTHCEDVYGKAYLEGDATAIFAYARADAWCLRSAWVVEQLETWRNQGTSEAARQIRKFFAAFARNRTTTNLRDLHTTIVKDQRILRSLRDHLDRSVPFADAVEHAAEDRSTSSENVREIHHGYESYVLACEDQQVPSGEMFSRLAQMAAAIQPPTI